MSKNSSRGNESHENEDFFFEAMRMKMVNV